MNRRAIIGLLAFGGLLHASQPSRAHDKPEVRLGAVVPSTGPFAEWGRANAVVLRKFEADVNASGGVNGAKLRIVIYDDGGKPAQAANLVRKLGDDDKVLAIAGPLTSSAAEVAFPVTNELKLVSMSQASAKPGVAAKNRPWAFRDTIDEAILARTTVPMFKGAFGIHSVAVIYDAKDANSVALGSKIMPAAMKEAGVGVLNDGSFLTFNTGDLDVSAQVTALKDLKPDGLVVAADYSQAITVLRELRRQGFVRPVIGGTPLISSAILKAAPELPIVAPATYFAGEKGGEAEAFTSQLTPLLREERGLPADIEPSMYDANVYEIAGLFVDAMRRGGVTGRPEELAQDRERIKGDIESERDFVGMTGPVRFNADGDAIKPFAVLVGKDGTWTEKARGCSAPSGQGC